jgi:hypothetical protein
MEWIVWINFHILIAIRPYPFDIDFDPRWKEFVRLNLNPLAYPVLASLLLPNPVREPFAGLNAIRFHPPVLIFQRA